MAPRAFACLLLIGCAAAAAQLPTAGSLPSFAQSGRPALLLRAEASLERGDPIAALDDFERAAMMQHAPDAEMGLIRAALQAGQYRRALAFAAHTAGGHLAAADAGALYAWLLRMGGQPALAERVLADTLARVPNEPVSSTVAAAFAAHLPIATGVLLQPPHRMAPWPTMLGGQPAPPVDARRVSAAALVSDGSLAVMPLAALSGSTRSRLWVRNGLGETTEAFIDRTNATLESAGVVVLRLRVAFDPGAPVPTDLREPFAGTPGYAVQFADTGDPAWPWLRQGFLGGLDRISGRRRLGFDADGGMQGAAVLDAGGRLVGLTLREADQPTTWLPAAAWRALAVARPETPTSAPAAPAVPRALVAPDVIYEGGLRIALQVLAAD